MPSLSQVLLLAAVPFIGLAIFLSPWLQDATSKVLESWKWAQNAPQVKLSQGVVVGTVLDDKFPAPIEAFMGLPYAQPPTGDRRFRRAVPLPASEEVFHATQYGPICPGKQLLKGVAANSSEDCMTVNIFRQKLSGSEKLPVALYFHGGAYNRGSSRMHNTASMVAWSESPFIGVSFNYRIGALGFLPSKLTYDEKIVNLGLHDQVFMLQWIQDNIEQFGGDKNDVTVFGLSAGAHSIGHHTLNYKEGVSPLFHKAILESGAATSRAVHPANANIHEAQFHTFVKQAGCSKVPQDQTMTCLRSVSEEAIVSASIAVFDAYNPSLRWAFQPVIDHEIIHKRPIDSWDSWKWNKVPTMTGHATNEGTYYVPHKTETAAEFTSFFNTLLPHFQPDEMKELHRIYPDPATDPKATYKDDRDLAALGLGAQFKRLEAAYAHYAYICPVRQTASYISSATAIEPGPPLYVFHWALNSSVTGGANHGDNMYYQSYQNSITSISEAQKEVSGMYHAYVTSFITKGDPNAIQGRYKDRPFWKQFESRNVGGGEAVLTFGKGNDERAGGTEVGVPAQQWGSRWIRPKCEFWMDMSRITEGHPRGKNPRD